MNSSLESKFNPSTVKKGSSGSFTTLYKFKDVERGNKSRCIIKTTDPLREIYLKATCYGKCNNKHIPKYYDRAVTDDGHTLYEMELYKPIRVKELNKTGLKNYRALMKLENTRANLDRRHWKTTTAFDTWLRNNLHKYGLTPLVYDAIMWLWDTACDYTDRPMLEFPRRNLAMDNRGNLILLDIMFCRDTLEEMWRREL